MVLNWYNDRARVTLAALAGVAGGLVGTTAVLGSPEAGIVGAVGGGLVLMIATAMQIERRQA